jgi:hypothetical protein
MKKISFLLVLLIISTLVYSQNKKEGNDAIDGVKIITSKDRGSRGIKNTDNNPLINKINKLETAYLNIKATELQQNFSAQDLSKLKTKDEVYQSYINYLQEKVEKSSHSRIPERLRHKNRAILQNGTNSIENKKQ